MCIGCSPLANLVAGADPASRRGLVMRGAGAFALGAGALGGRFRCAAAQATRDPSGAADAVYLGGPVITMDDRRPEAEAVAERSSRILAVGARAEVEARRGPGTRVVDLGGRTLPPGFFDAHGHAVLVGLHSLSANLLPPPDGEGRDIAALQRLLRD